MSYDKEGRQKRLMEKHLSLVYRLRLLPSAQGKSSTAIKMNETTGCLLLNMASPVYIVYTSCSPATIVYTSFPDTGRMFKERSSNFLYFIANCLAHLEGA